MGMLVCIMTEANINWPLPFRDSSMVEQRPVDWQLSAGKRIEKFRDNGEPLVSYRAIPWEPREIGTPILRGGAVETRYRNIEKR